METPHTPVIDTRAATPGSAEGGGRPVEKVASAVRPKRGVPEGLWLKCDGCLNTIFRKEAEAMLNVCPRCGHHWYV